MFFLNNRCCKNAMWGKEIHKMYKIRSFFSNVGTWTTSILEASIREVMYRSTVLGLWLDNYIYGQFKQLMSHDAIFGLWEEARVLKPMQAQGEHVNT